MFFFYRKGEEEKTFFQVAKAQKGDWIHIEQASSADLEQICPITGLHMSDVSDALDRYELPRLETIQNSIVLFIRYPVKQEKHLHTMPVTIILSPDNFITISLIDVPFIHALLQGENSASLCKASEFLLQILLKVSQEFNAQIRKARHEVMASGKAIHTVTSEDILLLTEYEEILNQYLSSLIPLTEILKKLTTLQSPYLCMKTYREIDDILNAIRQSETLCGSLIKNIRNLRDSYQIVFANNLTKTIKLLTSMTIIFSIPNIVASIYGMNVHLPFSESRHAFSLLMAVMFVFSALCGYWFYRKKWM
jgi:magnesium transporter